MIVAYLCVCKSKKYHNRMYKQELQVSRDALILENMFQLKLKFQKQASRFPGYSIIFGRGGCEDDQIFKYS